PAVGKVVVQQTAVEVTVSRLGRIDPGTVTTGLGHGSIPDWMRRRQAGGAANSAKQFNYTIPTILCPGEKRPGRCPFPGSFVPLVRSHRIGTASPPAPALTQKMPFSATRMVRVIAAPVVDSTRTGWEPCSRMRTLHVTTLVPPPAAAGTPWLASPDT